MHLMSPQWVEGGLPLEVTRFRGSVVVVAMASHSLVQAHQAEEVY